MGITQPSTLGFHSTGSCLGNGQIGSPAFPTLTSGPQHWRRDKAWIWRYLSQGAGLWPHDEREDLAANVTGSWGQYCVNCSIILYRSKGSLIVFEDRGEWGEREIHLDGRKFQIPATWSTTELNFISFSWNFPRSQTFKALELQVEKVEPLAFLQSIRDMRQSQ